MTIPDTSNAEVPAEEKPSTTTTVTQRKMLVMKSKKRAKRLQQRVDKARRDGHRPFGRNFSQTATNYIIKDTFNKTKQSFGSTRKEAMGLRIPKLTQDGIRAVSEEYIFRVIREAYRNCDAVSKDGASNVKVPITSVMIANSARNVRLY